MATDDTDAVGAPPTAFEGSDGYGQDVLNEGESDKEESPVQLDSYATLQARTGALQLAANLKLETAAETVDAAKVYEAYLFGTD